MDMSNLLSIVMSCMLVNIFYELRLKCYVNNIPNQNPDLVVVN